MSELIDIEVVDILSGGNFVISLGCYNGPHLVRCSSKTDNRPIGFAASLTRQ